MEQKWKAVMFSLPTVAQKVSQCWVGLQILHICKAKKKKVQTLTGWMNVLAPGSLAQFLSCDSVIMTLRYVYPFQNDMSLEYLFDSDMYCQSLLSK